MRSCSQLSLLSSWGEGTSVTYRMFVCLSPGLFFPEGPPFRQRALRWITQIPVTLSQSFDHRGYSDLSLLSSSGFKSGWICSVRVRGEVQKRRRAHRSSHGYSSTPYGCELVYWRPATNTKGKYTRKLGQVNVLGRWDFCGGAMARRRCTAKCLDGPPGYVSFLSF